LIILQINELRLQVGSALATILLISAIRPASPMIGSSACRHCPAAARDRCADGRVRRAGLASRGSAGLVFGAVERCGRNIRGLRAASPLLFAWTADCRLLIPVIAFFPMAFFRPPSCRCRRKA